MQNHNLKDMSAMMDIVHTLVRLNLLDHQSKIFVNLLLDEIIIRSSSYFLDATVDKPIQIRSKDERKIK